MANEVTTSSVTKVTEIEFVNKFNQGFKALQTLLGVASVQRVAAGSQVKIYATSGTLGAQPTTEGGVIPLSGYSTAGTAVTISPKLYRKATTYKAIAQSGYEAAVNKTDMAMAGDVRKAIRAGLYANLAGLTYGDGNSATGVGLQKAVAAAWAALEVAFENDEASPVYFMNAADVAGYLGTAQVNLAQAFGFSYVENFLGMGTLIVDSNVEAGTFYATAKENLNIFCAEPAPEIGLYTDESGLVGIKHDFDTATGNVETFVACGATLVPEIASRVVEGTITEPTTQS